MTSVVVVTLHQYSSKIRLVR